MVDVDSGGYKATNITEGAQLVEINTGWVGERNNKLMINEW